MRRYCALSHLDVTDTGASRSGAKAAYVLERCAYKTICSHLLAAVRFQTLGCCKPSTCNSKAVGWPADLTGE